MEVQQALCFWQKITKTSLLGGWLVRRALPIKTEFVSVSGMTAGLHGAWYMIAEACLRIRTTQE
jgi:hypothetical protein